MAGLKYLNTCACVDAMDRISSKVFLRMSYEFGVCFLKRELIPTIVSIALKSLISNIGTLRNPGEDAAYINLYDIVTLGLVELNFDETEKATNILPDFRIGVKGCELMKMNYDRYNSRQVPLSKYKGRVLNVKTGDVSEHTVAGLIQGMNDAIFANVGFIIDDMRITTRLLEVFLEEVFYDLGDHKGIKDYTYKLYDILYFNYIEKDDMWGTDVMPEYKLMVKNDAYSEDMINDTIDKTIKDKEEANRNEGRLHY